MNRCIEAGFVHNEALAYELAARFYAGRDFEKVRGCVPAERLVLLPPLVRYSNLTSCIRTSETKSQCLLRRARSGHRSEFVEGETPENLIKRLGPLAIKLALEIATQVAAGLAAVHEQNLVHRDIKPKDIMVRLKEERSVAAKIIDLGLAKTLD